jgi:hypothetical protein
VHAPSIFGLRPSFFGLHSPGLIGKQTVIRAQQVLDFFLCDAAQERQPCVLR